MDISKLTKFDWLAAGAGLLTLISLWFPWYSVKAGAFSESASAWESLDGIDILVLLLSLAAIALVALRLVPNLKVPVPTSLVLMGIGAAIVLLVLFRIIDKPWDSSEVNNGFFQVDAGVSWGIFASLLFGAAIAGAGFLKLSEGPVPTLGAAGQAPQYGQQAYPPQYGGQQVGAAPQYAAPQAPPQYAAPQAPSQYAAPQAPSQYAAPQAPAPGAPAAAVAPAAQPAAGFGFCTSCGAAYGAADAQYCTSCGAQRAQ